MSPRMGFREPGEWGTKQPGSQEQSKRKVTWGPGSREQKINSREQEPEENH